MQKTNDEQQNNSKEYNEANALIDDTKSELLGYINKRIKYFKLGVYDKSSLIGSYLTYALVVILMVYFIAFFALLALGYLLGEVFGSNAAGFGVLIVVCLIGLFIFLKKSQRFRRYISNLIVSLIRKVESDEE